VILHIIENDYILSGLENGEFSIWNKTLPSQTLPAKIFHIRDKISSLKCSKSTCYIHTIREDKSEELVVWPINVKKLSKASVHVSTDSKAEMDGHLITLKDLKLKANKKRHYFQLRGNVLYEFKSNRVRIPLVFQFAVANSDHPLHFRKQLPLAATSLELQAL